MLILHVLVGALVGSFSQLSVLLRGTDRAWLGGPAGLDGLDVVPTVTQHPGLHRHSPARPASRSSLVVPTWPGLHVLSCRVLQLSWEEKDLVNERMIECRSSCHLGCPILISICFPLPRHSFTHLLHSTPSLYLTTSLSHGLLTSVTRF